LTISLCWWMRSGGKIWDSLIRDEQQIVVSWGGDRDNQ
jgi:hypothetical protein